MHHVDELRVHFAFIIQYFESTQKIIFGKVTLCINNISNNLSCQALKMIKSLIVPNTGKVLQTVHKCVKNINFLPL